MKELRKVAPRFLASSTGVGVLLAGALLLRPDQALAQCSMCRDAAAASSPETREAMNYAIIGLALSPYGVAALAAWVLSPSVRAFVRAGLRRRKSSNEGGAV